jgi:hypothetical protein
MLLFVLAFGAFSPNAASSEVYPEFEGTAQSPLLFVSKLPSELIERPS